MLYFIRCYQLEDLPLFYVPLRNKGNGANLATLPCCVSKIYSISEIFKVKNVFLRINEIRNCVFPVRACSLNCAIVK